MVADGNNKRALKAKDVMELLGCSRTTAYALLAQYGVKIGGLRRIRADVVERLLVHGTSEPRRVRAQESPIFFAMGLEQARERARRVEGRGASDERPLHITQPRTKPRAKDPS